MTDQTINVKNLMEEMGLSGLPEEKQEELMVKMTEALLKRLFVETAEKLNGEDQEAYAKMIEDKAAPEEIENFLKSRIKDYDDMLERTVADFKKEVKEGIV